VPAGPQHIVNLLWKASTSPVVGYNVYRRGTECRSGSREVIAFPAANKKARLRGNDAERRNVLRAFRSPSRMTADAFYDFCCLTHIATELAIAMTKNSMAPSRKLLYEIGFFPNVGAESANTPITASSRVITARAVEMTPIQ
jgi:hypothetical protein